jgi:segregation and condensation protein B
MSESEHGEIMEEEHAPVPEAQRDVEAVLPMLEALLFAAGDPVTLEDKDLVEPALSRLLEVYGEDRGLQIVRLAGGYRMVTRTAYDRYIRALVQQRNRRRLGRAALETLAIVAYRQPVTGPEISEIRGKDSAGVLKGLVDKRLLRITGRKRVVGKPFLYGTTREFLLHFGLDSLDDLPDMAEFEAMLQERVAQVEEIPLPEFEDCPEGDLPEHDGNGGAEAAMGAAALSHHTQHESPDGPEPEEAGEPRMAAEEDGPNEPEISAEEEEAGEPEDPAEEESKT